MSKVNNIKSRWENIGNSQKNSPKTPPTSRKHPAKTDTPTGHQIQAGQMQELDSILKSLEGFALKEGFELNEKTNQNVDLKVTEPPAAVEELSYKPADDEAAKEDEDGITMRKDKAKSLEGKESEQGENVRSSDSKVRDSLQEEKERIKEAREKLRKSSRDLTLDLQTLALMPLVMDETKVDKINEQDKENCEAVVMMRKDIKMEEQRNAVKSAEYTARDSHKEEKDMLKDAREKLKKTSRDVEFEKGEADVIFRKKESLNPADTEHRKSARLSLRNSLASVLEDDNESEDKVEKPEDKMEKPEDKVEKPEVKVEETEDEEVEKRDPEFKEMLGKLERSTSFESFKDLAIKTFMSVTDELAKVKKEMRELKSSSAPAVPAPPPMAAPPPPPPPPPPALAPPTKLVIVPAKRKTVTAGSDVVDAPKPAAFDLMAEIKKKQNARNNRASLKVKLAKLN